MIHRVKEVIRKAKFIIRYRLKERSFKTEQGLKIHYIFNRSNRKKGNRVLIVVFSGFAGENKAGRYNYVRSLDGLDCDRLFIKDDFGYRKVGSYYLGPQCLLYKNSEIQSFIKIRILANGPYQKIIFMGTSKGGTAALLYGIQMNADEIIIGSPQYCIAKYLSLNDYHKKILKGILDDENGYDENWLNSLLKKSFCQYDYNGRVVLLYSTKEKSWTETKDTVELVADLKKTNWNIELIDKEYKDHNDVGFFFSQFVKQLYL